MKKQFLAGGAAAAVLIGAMAVPAPATASMAGSTASTNVATGTGGSNPVGGALSSVVAAAVKPVEQLLPTLITTVPDILRKVAPPPASGGRYYNDNWSGYADHAPDNDISAVHSTFTVPDNTRSLWPGIAGTWTGIGGYTGDSLIQAGVTENTLPNVITNQVPIGGQHGYHAFYELIPAGAVAITSGCTGDPTCTVTPGDTITVDIKNVSGNTWTFDIADQGTWTWTKDVTYKATDRSSAEYVSEAAAVAVAPLIMPNATTTTFTDNTYTENGQTKTVAEGHPTTLITDPGDAVNIPIPALAESQPSTITAGGSFNTCRWTLGCPTPPN